MATSSFTRVSCAGAILLRAARVCPGPAARRMMPTMADEKIEIVRSTSSGVVGRARNSTRDAGLVLDSSTRPQPDAFTNSEAFLAGVSSCGVTLIEMHAQETGIPMTAIQVTIDGARTAAEPNRFATVTMTFEIAGVSQSQADELVATYRGR